MTVRTLSLTGLAALVLSPSVAAQLPLTDTLLLDINDEVQDKDGGGSGFFGFGPSVFFRAGTPALGTELWVTDTAGSGASMVLDIDPGPGHSGPSELVPVGGGFVFRASTAVEGSELWFSDGTGGGTQLVADIWPGYEDSAPLELTEMGGVVYFAADDGTHGTELWRTDGTAAGTWPVADIAPGASSAGPRYLTAMGGVLYFSAYTPTDGRELWRSDGTAAGTWQVVDFWPGFGHANPNALTAIGDQLYLSASTPEEFDEPWVTDGTATGTVSLGNLSPTSGSSPKWFTPLGDLVVFTAAVDGFAEHDLWVTDGTAVGTSRIWDVAPPDEVTALTYGFVPQALPTGEDVLLFSFAFTGPGGLWRTDGTAAGTTLVATPPVGTFHSMQLTPLGGLQWFATDQALWRTDGTTAGTIPVTVSGQPSVSSVTAANGALWLQADGGDGKEPWRSDGTAAGTHQVADIGPQVTPNSLPNTNLVRAGDRVLFTANHAPGDNPLWSTDGTAAGTQPISDVAFEAVASQWKRTFAPLQTRVVFLGTDDDHGKEPWITDGTAAGTHLLADLNPGPAISNITWMVHHEGKVYFDAFTPDFGYELWTTDGEVVRQVVDLTPGLGGTYPTDLASIGGKLYFETLPNGATSSSVYATPGEQGPFEELATGLSQVRLFTQAGDKVIFRAYTSATGHELWVTDGTPAGTALLADLEPGPDSSEPAGLSPLGERTLFTVKTSDSGGESRLWATDGTAAGTAPLFPSALDAPTVYNITPATTLAFFEAELDDTTSLWATDGTLAGTEELLALPPGGWIHEITHVGSGDRVVADLRLPQSGSEVRLSDGTAAGTVQLTDTAADTGNADPEHFVRLGDQILFVADDGLTGEELHAIPFAATGDYVTEPFGWGCSTSGDPAPLLAATGVPTPGRSFDLAFTDAYPTSPAIAIASTGLTHLPIFDCALFVALPWYLLDPVVTDPSGTATQSVRVPGSPGIVALPIYLQAFVVGAGEHGLTNGVELLVGP